MTSLHLLVRRGHGPAPDATHDTQDVYSLGVQPSPTLGGEEQANGVDA